MPARWHAATRALFISAFLFWGAIYGCGTSLADSPASVCQSRQFDETVVVAKIYDGDTIKLTDERVVRFIGINTPELSRDFSPAQALAVEAKQTLAELLPIGAKLGLAYDQERKDHYQRTLAHVYLPSGQNLAAELIRRGYGFAIVVPPNTKQTACYFISEAQARKHGRGIWSNPAYTPKTIHSLTKSDTGFQYFTGTVTGIGQGKKNIWLDMGEGFSVRIQRKYLQYFVQMPLESLAGRQLRVRGWVSFYNDKLRMTIGHPAMMEIVD
jgi:endonuclease YncB( thermonuclease family)